MTYTAKVTNTVRNSDLSVSISGVNLLTVEADLRTIDGVYQGGEYAGEGYSGEPNIGTLPMASRRSWDAHRHAACYIDDAVINYDAMAHNTTSRPAPAIPFTDEVAARIPARQARRGGGWRDPAGHSCNDDLDFLRVRTITNL